jgi:hypothetical protein
MRSALSSQALPSKLSISGSRRVMVPLSSKVDRRVSSRARCNEKSKAICLPSVVCTQPEPQTSVRSLSLCFWTT